MTEPTTAAGLYLYHGIAIRGQEDKALRSILAIEAEARAAALDEARAAIEHCGLHPESLAGELALAAIDALREVTDKPNV